MVDRADLQRASMLYEELRTIDMALANFDAGGAIVAMTVSAGEETFPPTGPGPGGPRTTVTVPTGALQYPQQMVDAIKAQFEARKNAVAQELTSVGVTGAS